MSRKHWQILGRQGNANRPANASGAWALRHRLPLDPHRVCKDQFAVAESEFVRQPSRPKPAAGEPSDPVQAELKPTLDRAGRDRFCADCRRKECGVVAIKLPVSDHAVRKMCSARDKSCLQAIKNPAAHCVSRRGRNREEAAVATDHSAG